MQAPTLNRFTPFAGLPDDALTDIYRAMRPRQFAAGDVLFRAGDPGDSLFVIESGLLLVTLSPSEGQGPSAATIDRLRRGDVVGEMALLTGEPRSATVIAAVPTAVWELDRSGFGAVIARHPEVLLNLTRVLSHRLYRATLARAQRPRRGEVVGVIVDRTGLARASAIVAATAAAHPRGALAIDLTGQLAASPLVTSPGESSVAAALALLDEVLPHQGVTLVVAALEQDALPTLLAQTDRNLAMVGAESVAQLAALPSELVGSLEVALLADGPRDGRGDPFPAVQVIRMCALDEIDKDVAWIGRHISRTKLGLALGAGGPRAYAHVATIQVLENAGYTIDAIAACSQGVFVGAWYALEPDGKALEATMRGFYTPETSARMAKVPTMNVAEAVAEFSSMLQQTTGNGAFSDLRIPLVALTVDLDAREPLLIAEGFLWEALLAATALPGLWPPYVREGRRLVDGVCLVPVPSDAARAIGADVVVSVNLMSRDTLPAWPGEPLPEPAAARARMRMVDALMEMVDLAQVDASIAHAARADVTITPRFGPATWYEFERADQFLAAGRAAALEQLPALQSLARAQG